MDDFVKQKLKSWNLEELEEIFEKNKIDEEEFNNLEYKDIYDLIPILGLRKKFLRQFDAYSGNIVTKDNKTDTDSVASEEPVEDHSSTVSVVSSDSYSSVTAIPTENRDTSFYGAHDVGRALGLEFPDFELEALLKSAPYGKTILAFYEKNNKLDDTLRSTLVDIIAKHVYNYVAVHRLKYEQYMVICKKITTLFPTEAEASYYIPYVPKGTSGQDKGILARGRLVDKIRNILDRSGDTVAHKRKRETDEGPSYKKAKHQLNPIEQASIQFLNNFRELYTKFM